MAKKIPSTTKQLLFTLGVAAAKNKHTRRLALRGWRAVLSNRHSRRAVARIAADRASHKRPLMIGVASVAVVSAAGAALSKARRGGTDSPE